MRSIGDSSILKKIASEGLSFAKKPNNSRKKAKSFAGDNKENYADNKRDYRGELTKHWSTSFPSINLSLHLYQVFVYFSIIYYFEFQVRSTPNIDAAILTGFGDDIC